MSSSSTLLLLVLLSGLSLGGLAVSTADAAPPRSRITAHQRSTNKAALRERGSGPARVGRGATAGAGGFHRSRIERVTEIHFRGIREQGWVALDAYPLFNFARHQNVLLLSDGGAAGHGFPRSRPDQFIVASDYHQRPGVNVRLDNMRLPFKGDSFDLIVLNRGLCPCSGGGDTCGGIPVERGAMTRFLESVIHVLDKKSPNSLAVLTGFYFPGNHATEVPRLWNQVVADLSAKHPEVRIGTLHDPRLPSEGGFMGVTVASANGPSATDRIQRLLD